MLGFCVHSSRPESAARAVAAVVFLCSAGIGGCDNFSFDVSSVQLREPDGGSPPRDTADTSDLGEPDGADVPDVDIPPPRNCEGALTNIDGCDPSDPSACGGSETCTPRPLNDRAVCVRDGEFGDGGRGSECELGGERRDCDAGLHCVDWTVTSDPRSTVCSSFCVLASGAGCAEDEFCTNPFGEDRLEGLGFCTERCDPADPDSCPANADCVLDPNYPEDTCKPEFRCISTVDAPDRAVGASCDRTNVPEDGCGDDLVCAPVGAEGGDVCVRPCSTETAEAVCEGAECVESEGPWEISFCDRL